MKWTNKAISIAAVGGAAVLVLAGCSTGGTSAGGDATGGGAATLSSRLAYQDERPAAPMSQEKAANLERLGMGMARQSPHPLQPRQCGSQRQSLESEKTCHRVER